MRFAVKQLVVLDFYRGPDCNLITQFLCQMYLMELKFCLMYKWCMSAPKNIADTLPVWFLMFLVLEMKCNSSVKFFMLKWYIIMFRAFFCAFEMFRSLIKVRSFYCRIFYRRFIGSVEIWPVHFSHFIWVILWLVFLFYYILKELKKYGKIMKLQNRNLKLWCFEIHQSNRFSKANDEGTRIIWRMLLNTIEDVLE